MAISNYYSLMAQLLIQDRRRGIWTTVNAKGVKRIRKLRDNSIYDEQRRYRLNEKIDPETNARVIIREDGVLNSKIC
jgi:hypothetical protein